MTDCRRISLRSMLLTPLLGGVTIHYNTLQYIYSVPICCIQHYYILHMGYGKVWGGVYTTKAWHSHCNSLDILSHIVTYGHISSRKGHSATCDIMRL